MSAAAAASAARRLPLRTCLGAGIGWCSSTQASAGVPRHPVHLHRRRPGPAVLASAVRPASAAAPRKHRLIFLGTPQVAATALEALFDAAAAPGAAFEIHAVVSQPGKPRGRSRSSAGAPAPSPVAEAALRRGLDAERVLCPAKANEGEFLAAVAAMEPDLMVTAAYGNFLPQRFLDLPRLGTLNIHPSLLPQFRGAAPVQRALEAGVPVTGVTVAYTAGAYTRPLQSST